MAWQPRARLMGHLGGHRSNIIRVGIISHPLDPGKAYPLMTYKVSCRGLRLRTLEPYQCGI